MTELYAQTCYGSQARPPRGGAGGDNDPGAHQRAHILKGPIRGLMSWRGPREGPMGFIGLIEMKPRRTYFCGDHLNLKRKTVSILGKTFFFGSLENPEKSVPFSLPVLDCTKPEIHYIWVVPGPTLGSRRPWSQDVINRHCTISFFWCDDAPIIPESPSHDNNFEIALTCICLSHYTVWRLELLKLIWGWRWLNCCTDLTPDCTSVQQPSLSLIDLAYSNFAKQSNFNNCNNS